MREQVAHWSAQIRRSRVARAFCCLLFAAGASPLAAGGDEIIDRILAVVAGDLIMLSDVNAALDFHLVSVSPDAADPIRDILPRLIDRALVLAEVERYAPPEPGAETVNRQFQAVRATFPTDQAFGVALARVGFAEKHLRETLRQNLRIRAYLDQRFTVQPPTEDDLGRYYREHPQFFTHDGRLTPFEEARLTIVEAATAERRQRLVDDWVAGLRRRAEILDLSIGSR
jgi:hypothetical protein